MSDTTPTSRWLAAAAPDLEPLVGPEGIAERLLLLLHYGIDWDAGWVGNYRATYWDRMLPDRVVLGTYLCPNLRSWWDQVAHELVSAPRNAAERQELATLQAADSRPVLKVLRNETAALILRTRIVTERVRSARPIPPAKDDAA